MSDLVFSDDDLELFKKELTKFDNWDCQECALNTNFNLKALFARLEAAEVAMGTLAEVHQGDCDNGDCAEVLEAWRKSAGMGD